MLKMYIVFFSIFGVESRTEQTLSLPLQRACPRGVCLLFAFSSCFGLLKDVL